MYSFDVFDTLITRTTATPVGIFALVEKELKSNTAYTDIPAYVRNNFFEIRKNLEPQLMYQYDKSGKVLYDDVRIFPSYDDIYVFFQNRYALTAEQSERIKRLEIEIELNNSVPVVRNLQKVVSILERGEIVVFISDMYLPEKIISDLISKHYPVLKGIPVFVSNEFGCGKSDGKLFQIVSERINDSTKAWEHIGDNEKADVIGAKFAGCDINAIKYEYPKLFDFEMAILNDNQNDVDIQMTIGASRNARLNCEYDATNFNNEFNYGLTYAAPVIVNYVLWILEQCKIRNIRRLYFIARDGYVPMKVADILIKKFNLNISTKYIYGSRKAWCTAGFTEAGCGNLQFLTIRNFADYFEISSEEMMEFFPMWNLDERMTYSRQLAIESSIGITDLIGHRQEKNTKLTSEYFEAEVDFSDEYFAFVDAQGSGHSLHAAQCCISDKIYSGKFLAFFMAGSKKRVINEKFEMCCYTYNHKWGGGVENLCRSPEGITLKYRKEGSRIMPEFGEKEFIKFDFEAYVTGIELFIESYFKKDGNSASKYNVFIKYLEVPIASCDEEILMFHDIFSHSTEENGGVLLAPKLSRQDIKRIFLSAYPGESETKYYRGCYLDISLARCGEQDKRLISFCKRHQGDLLGKIYRLPKLFTSRQRDKLLPGKVVVYGAGKIGSRIYARYKRKCVLLVDSNYAQYNHDGNLAVRSPQEITKVHFDYLIIAISNKNIVDFVECELIDKGINQEKILWFREIE
jgi:predicted HAD superfamily hydrolase